MCVLYFVYDYIINKSINQRRPLHRNRHCSIVQTISDPKGKESHTLMLPKFLNVLASNFQRFKLSGISGSSNVRGPRWAPFYYTLRGSQVLNITEFRDRFIIHRHHHQRINADGLVD